MKGVFMRAEAVPKKEYKLKDYEKVTGKYYQANNVWKNPKLEVRGDLPMPAVGPKDLLIQVKSCGVCGTDVHCLEHDNDGYVVYPWHLRLNIVLGHELSGVVAQVGSEVRYFAVGDYVCTEEMIWCGECIPCRNGFPNQCERLEEIGLTVDGGMADYCVSPAKICWKLDPIRELYGDSRDVFDFGALVEPVSVAYNAIFERGQGFRPGAYCAVYGGGPIGLFGTALMKAGGASKVIVFEPLEERRRLAKVMGADYVYDTNDLAKNKTSPAELVMELTRGRGADVNLEASGVGHIVFPEIVNSIAVNANIVQTALSGEPVPILFPPLQGKGAQIFSSIGHSGNGTFENVIRLMGAGMIDIRPLIGASYTLDQAHDAFAEAKKRISSVIMFKN